jgi:tRNA uridine 5-carboxymethylaminomethyl modification enzyme
MQQFDIIVVGGGHAGEAAAVAARMGASVALVSFDLSVIGAMSCNPAIGGWARAIWCARWSFDGLMGRGRCGGDPLPDAQPQQGQRRAGPAFRRTAAVQGGDPAYVAPAALAANRGRGRRAGDRRAACGGVDLADGSRLTAPATILCTGTFWAASCFAARKRLSGRIGEAAAHRLAAQMRESLPMARLKTGTPPRLDGRTIDWARLEEQPSDPEPWCMSALEARRPNPQVFCAITRTNPHTHDIIRANLHRSPLFSGAIGARGPRYCPSIEDKIHRFADRDGHQIFLEPEGLDNPLVYPTAFPPACRRCATGDDAQHGRAGAGGDHRARLCGRI